jgi:hypothetical protein
MGNKILRTAILLAVLLCGQALAFAHAFEHPVAIAHLDHACSSCAHGYFGSAPPSQPATLSFVPTIHHTPGLIVAGYRHACATVCHLPRAPPNAFV